MPWTATRSPGRAGEFLSPLYDVTPSHSRGAASAGAGHHSGPARCSILPSRDRETNGTRSDLVAFPLSDWSKANSDRSEPPLRKSR